MLTSTDRRVLRALPWILSIAIASVFLESYFSFTEEQVHGSIEKKHQEEHNTTMVSVSYDGVFGFWDLLWQILRRNSDPILAASTIAIAWFTIRIFANESENRKRELRAYVSARPSHVDSINPFKMMFEIINHGQTPAHDLIDNGMADIFPYPLPPNFVFPDFPAPRPTSLVLHPGVDSYSGDLEARRIFTLDELRKCAEGTKFRLYVFGIIEYRDIFGDRHTTKFCNCLHGGQIIVDAVGNASAAAQIKAETTSQHNEAD